MITWRLVTYDEQDNIVGIAEQAINGHPMRRDALLRSIKRAESRRAHREGWRARHVLEQIDGDNTFPTRGRV